MEFTINTNNISDFDLAINSIPIETEILIIENLRVPRGRVIDNLPCLLKEIRVHNLLFGRICLLEIEPESVNQIFPKIPFDCEVKLENDYMLVITK